MRKFKLIKEYPGSPKLGHVNGGTMNDLSLSIVDNNPEFWEEIIEKDYEILSFKTNDLRELTLLDLHLDGKYAYKKGGDYKNKGSLTKQQCLDNNFYQIYSVKRLSDGEIFTIGDEISFNIHNNTPNYPYGTIESIELVKSGIYISRNNPTWTNELKNIAKLIKPLFKTEDGVDVFEGDTTWFVNLLTYSLIKGVLPISHKDVIHFSIKEKAEEYILMHKKSLSLNDILNVWSELSKHSCESLEKNSILFNKFKEFVIEQQSV